MSMLLFVLVMLFGTHVDSYNEPCIEYYMGNVTWATIVDYGNVFEDQIPFNNNMVDFVSINGHGYVLSIDHEGCIRGE